MGSTPICGYAAWQPAGLGHLQGTIAQLLAGLEDELDHTGKIRAPSRQHPGGDQQDGHVPVMPASVHDPLVLRSIGQAGLLLDGQGIQLCPQRHATPRLAAAQQPHHPGAGHPRGDLSDAQPGQILGDCLGSLVLGEGQFGMPVQILADFAGLLEDLDVDALDLLGGHTDQHTTAKCPCKGCSPTDRRVTNPSA
jgi:hypothetical protein